MNYRFANEPFFNQTMNAAFKDADDLKAYFIGFLKEYFETQQKIDPMSRARMQGEAVDGYDEIHKHYHQLKQHYALLLTVGTNGFNVWLNDFVPLEYKASGTNFVKTKTKRK